MNNNHQDGGGPSNDGSYIKRLIYLFGIVYFAQGLAQASGLISQPLSFYLKEVMHFDEAQSTAYLAVLTIPWLIKPLYGLVSDFIPLFGYRRKTWLLALNAMSACAFFWLTGLSDASLIVSALLLTAVGTAASDVIVDAVMVENGQKYNMVGKFQSVQWFWFYTAQIATSIAGGWIAGGSDPASALHTAALITMCAPATVALLSWFGLKEDKSRINTVEMKKTALSLGEAFKSPTLWGVVTFLAFYNFSPSFGTPMYYHMVDKLKFSQEFIGTLGAIGSAGAVIGTFLYGWYFTKKTLHFQLTFAILAGAIGTFSYLSVVQNSPMAGAIMVGLSLVFGAAGAIATLTVLSLAGRACPKKAEGFTFAALMSVYNGFAQLSAIVGSWMFVHWFDRSLSPLIIVSGVFTLACFLLVPLLKGVNDDAESGNGK
ncbi:MAG: MFS transporter [Candidatus Obscuribacter sp.]|nr:MFS transporter [Candidatus Melainabacteria bacterium]MDX1986067.1 MFS transporter [Candidatus Obscuribacter sp.]